MSSLVKHVVESALDASSPQEGRLQSCTLDTKITCNDARWHDNWLNDKRTYRGDNADIRKSLDTGFLQRYAAVALITDGFQSGSTGAPAGSDGGDCMGPHCLGTHLQRLASDGYGVWLVSVTLGFNGFYYTERSADDAFPRMLEHMEKLNAENVGGRYPFGIHCYADPCRELVLEGTRPILVFILSRNHAEGRSIYERIVQQLEVESENLRFPNGFSQDVRFAELAPLLENWRGWDAEPPSQVVQCEGDEMRDVAFTGPEFPMPAPEYLNVVALWERTLGGDFASCGVSGCDQHVYTSDSRVTDPTPFSTQFRIDCARAPHGAVSQIRFELRARLELRPQVEDVWFMRSAQNTLDHPERVFGLDTIVCPTLYDSIRRRASLPDGGWRRHVSLVTDEDIRRHPSIASVTFAVRGP